MENIEEIRHPDDMTTEEVSALQVFVKNKLPGVSRIGESDIFRWFEMYMSGKTYFEIAELTNSKLTHVLYTANKLDWHQNKIEHYKSLIVNMEKKITEVKLDSTSTIATIIAAFNKYYQKKFNTYLAKGDHSLIEDLDIKVLAQYYKSIDTLDKIVSPKKSSDSAAPSGESPSVNIIVGGDSTTIKTADGNSIEITDENAGKYLEGLAGEKKKQEDK